MSLKGLFPAVSGPQTFSQDDVLKFVAEFVVCNDQQSLAIASKPTFQNCLAAMQPASTKADLPSTHDVSNYVHNKFVLFIKKLKDELQVMSFNAVFIFLPF
ncbi:hypothetical protein PAXRUDRAFT_164713 [Paxillus rubicundulus Ve08.2h10]|uniref:Uncharacterized protein n=1 Tax=Paxillus rubicundulus Ve08.2h10 TaxID=930991 RepID=A0A0D0DBZ3_9AGAM|nr:hypothetical protein PAXRUDRAFT_164713 [Paxillus rubicundulus Ve08.2h10]